VPGHYHGITKFSRKLLLPERILYETEKQMDTQMGSLVNNDPLFGEFCHLHKKANEYQRGHLTPFKKGLSFTFVG
jgi:hypothetical protein